MTDRPSVWLVSPAWGRFAVTRLALAQRAHLAGELAPRGIDCQAVIVANDENLDIAEEFGFATVVMDNDSGVGRKFNAGFRYAAEQGADWLVHIGSDDWVHPDVFGPLLEMDEPHILTGRRIAFLDLLTGVMCRRVIGGPHGVIPWVVPRVLMEASGFQPIRPDRYRGMDGFLIRGLAKQRRRLTWKFHDPNDLARIDFKSDVNINTFRGLPSSLTKDAAPDPWGALAERYPAHLVQMAQAVHQELSSDSDRSKAAA